VITFNSDVPSKEIVQSEETGETHTEDHPDLALAKNCIDLIPSEKFGTVVKELTTDIVKVMPAEVLKHMSGDNASQEMAEAILFQYYLVIADKEQIIIDAFEILGKRKTIRILDSLELPKS
jgi:hypothetical protein